jgi:hypothetical protein
MVRMFCAKRAFSALFATKWMITDTYDNQRAASKKAHERERRQRAPNGYAGYKLIKTAGV